MQPSREAAALRRPTVLFFDDTMFS